MLFGVLGALLIMLSSGNVDVPATADEPPNPPPPPPSEVALHRALGMQGAPYVPGGADPAVGFDCSGLTHWAYAQSGIDLSRTTWGQWAESTRVDEPQPGDLVFFNTTGGISHVGINIDGKSFIHAVDYGKPVQITPYDAPYWSGRIVGFGRIDY